MDATAYAAKLERERKVYEHNVNVHELPQIYHFWSNRFLKPKLDQLGLSGPGLNGVFVDPILKIARRRPGVVKVASLGCGNCDFEIAIVKQLIAAGCPQVQMHCYDINRDMLARGRRDAEKEGIAAQMRFVERDVNQDDFAEPYDVFMANQSLHHFVGLEHLFATIRKRLNPGGIFATSDMIGRNGHMFWPEAYKVVCDLCRLLPHKYKYNHQLKRVEDPFDNWDCSSDGFEGIRAQDILPLLLKHFQFELFVGFCNISDVFIGRAFGHNFRQDDPFDAAFIDFVGQLDERLIREGALTPTHLIAWMTVEKPAKLLSIDGQTPQTSVRQP